jgi:hypothetical protein
MALILCRAASPNYRTGACTTCLGYLIGERSPWLIASEVTANKS